MMKMDKLLRILLSHQEKLYKYGFFDWKICLPEKNCYSNNEKIVKHDESPRNIEEIIIRPEKGEKY